MAPPKKNQFKPGVSGNPAGRPPVPPAIHAIRRMTHAQVAEIGTVLLEGDLAAIEAITRDPKASVLKVWIASLIVTSLNKGDASIFNAIMDRIVGKVRDRLKIEGSIAVAHFTPDQVKRMAQLAIEEANEERDVTGSV